VEVLTFLFLRFECCLISFMVSIYFFFSNAVNNMLLSNLIIRDTHEIERYEYFKAEARARSPTSEESPMDLLLSSGLSKMCASVTTYPHEVLRSRMMDYRGSDPQGQTLISTFRRVTSNEGYLALYTGLRVSLIRVVPNCCITFMTYELIFRWAKKIMSPQ